MLLLLIILSVFAAVCFTVIGIFSVRRKPKVRDRVMRALGQGGVSADVDTQPLGQRVFRPLLHKTALQFGRWVPKRQREQIASRLGAAGLSGKWEEAEWKGLQLTISLCLGLLLLGLFVFLHAQPLVIVLMCIIGLMIGYLFPNVRLQARAKQRLKEIEKTLPDVLDLLTVSVEAGLGFDAALLKVAEKQKGVLAEEFLRVLQEIKMGRPRREALRDLAARHKTVEDLHNLVASLIQADQLGISIGGVLRNQARQIRQKQRQRVEEKAQKAPVKMLIPLVLFVFPTIFIVVLGPAVLQVIDILKH